ncbi:MAG: hypothetical protein JWR51_2286 [Devosia sp.]|uniref:Mov34/MPN/PAD-1 family protein n=1 Tax=Devosia sp. TaxID=1871048 RepID=UPI002620ECF0|nr:Mov34/MPN/PAD-1 family protein [Devosia sp.]MDB5529183.1 hypothetical protein [Devosia sp.]
MHLILAADQKHRLVEALTLAGTKEIGGQLFGELLEPSKFLITELVVQARPGSFARFVVDLFQAAREAMRFFDRTAHRYVAFNYIGEWHSHPSFAVRPSSTDVQTMRGLVLEPDFPGNFAVLVIVRLDVDELTVGSWVFDPQGRESEATFEVRT